MLWSDFATVVGRRLQGGDIDHSYTGDSLIVFSMGRGRFDLIVSKYGWGHGLKRNHHFFQRQAVINVDDLEDVA